MGARLAGTIARRHSNAGLAPGAIDLTFKGSAGQSFGAFNIAGVRLSGGTAVVEGLGDHGCEYMTGGVVAVLGEVGRNFAAGMSGGVAYVFDELGSFRNRCNRELVRVVAVSDYEAQEARCLIERHCEATGSPRAFDLLKSWQSSRTLMLRIAPHAEAAPETVAEAPSVSVAGKAGIAASFPRSNQKAEPDAFLFDSRHHAVV